MAVPTPSTILNKKLNVKKSAGVGII